VSQGTADQITYIFLRKMAAKGERLQQSVNLQQILMHQIKNSIPTGIVLWNNPVSDMYHPEDRELQIYIAFPGANIAQILDGQIRMKVLCRLSFEHNILTIRTIDKSFEYFDPQYQKPKATYNIGDDDDDPGEPDDYEDFIDRDDGPDYGD